MSITTFLIRRRDAAGEAWVQVSAMRTHAERRARRRLVWWDTLLDLWTDHGRRA